MSESLLELLRGNEQSGRIPMHMPGHKRNTERFPSLAALGAGMDITEIEGFDNLHGAESILAAAMERAAALWNSDRTYFLINGASCGILSGIRALTRRGDTVLVSRNAHKSVYHAIELCGLRPVFLMPPIDEALGVCLSLPPDTIRRALDRHPEARLLILTSPTYEGVVSDVRAAADEAHSRGIPLLVDEAHGAHFSLHPAFPTSSVRLGADITVASLHKTLPSLTQTAVLHVCGPRVDRARLEHQLAVFETSSPSYLLLTSLDECVRMLRERPEILDEWAARLSAFDKRLGTPVHLRIPGHGTPAQALYGAFDYDRSKIFVSSDSMSGYALAKHLRRCGVEPEMAAPNGVLLMSGAGDTSDAMQKTAGILREADALGNTAGSEFRALPCPLFPEGTPVLDVLPETALELPWEAVAPEHSAGRTAAEYVWAYPPGIPLLLPGERIPPAFPALCAAFSGLHGTRGDPARRVAVLR